MASILDVNCIGIQITEKDEKTDEIVNHGLASAIFSRSSLFNHSKNHNAFCLYKTYACGNLLNIYSLDDIKKGNEVSKNVFYNFVAFYCFYIFKFYYR